MTDKGKGDKPRLALVGGTEAGEKSKTRGPIDKETGVTAKQEAFARAHVLDGCSYTEAFRRSHAAESMNQNTIWRQAAKVAANPRVQARMDALVRDKKGKSELTGDRVKAFILDRLLREAEGDAPQARLRALELLGKLDFVGAFRDRVATETGPGKSAEELASELKDRLSKLLAS